MTSVIKVKTPTFQLKLDLEASIFSLQALGLYYCHSHIMLFPPKQLEVSSVGSNYYEKCQCVILPKSNV